MKAEERTIKASILAGITDMLIGLIMFLTGWHEWYYNHFHFFGILGIGMIAYGFWHKVLYTKETGVFLWKSKKK